MLEEKKFQKVLKVKNSKIIGLNLKNYFDEKNEISKKSKSNSESPGFFQKRNQKIENFEKNPVKLVYLKFFFFILGAILRTEDEKSEMNFEKSTNYFNL